MENGSPQALPSYVMLELTNACDIACRHCPFHGDGVDKQRPTGNMPESMWRSALEEIISWDTEVLVQPWGMGEPMLSPDIWNVVRAAKRGPKIEVGFYSNGNQWQDDDIEAALSSGLDWVTFSIDGLRKDVFEHYRVGADFERVLATLRKLAARRRERGQRKPEIRVNMVQYAELADHGDEFVEGMRKLADAVMVSRFREVGDRTFSPIELPRVPCYQLDSLFALSWNGTVLQCCEDQQGEAPVGRYPLQSMREIWFGPKLSELRAAHRQGRYESICADCDAWTGIYERQSDRSGLRVREKTATTLYEFGPADGAAE